MADEENRGLCERFKEVRTALGLKQGMFADKLQTTQGHISDIEHFRKVPSKRLIDIICLKFDVSKQWFSTGEGEMFNPRTREKELEKAFEGIKDDVFKRELVLALMMADESGWESIRKIFNEVSDKVT